MLIREVVEKDIPQLTKLLASMDGEKEMDTAEALGIWEKLKQYPYYKVFIVESDEKIVATFSLIIIDNLGHNGSKLAVVENVIVDKKLRGKGIGKQMMNYAMELAKTENCYKLMLSSNKNRIPAHKFYQRLGFKQHGISFMVEVN